MAEEALDLEQTIQDNALLQKLELQRQAEEQKALTQRSTESAVAARAQREPEWTKLQEAQAEAASITPPRLTRPPQAPNTQEMLKPTSLQQQFGIASIFALLSVGIAKGSAIYGLKALGGFMEGAHNSNQEQAAAALKDYNAKMEEVRAANEAAITEYNAIFNNKKLTLEMQERMFRHKALEFQDELALQTIEREGMQAAHGLLRERIKVDSKMADQLLQSRQIEAQIEHWRALEARALKADKTGADGITEAQIAKIQDQARMEISAGLPRDPLGNIILAPEWGKTIEERTRRFQVLVDKRKREIAAQRGLGNLFDNEPKTKEDPAMALNHAISTGQIPKDTKAAMNFLTQRGVSPTEAAAIIQRLASGGTEY